MDKQVFLDNNATTFMSDKVKEAMRKWEDDVYPLSDKRKKLHDSLTAFINRLNGLHDKYHIIFNSGASEGNCHIINAAVLKMRSKNKDKVPYIVTSKVEHKSTLKCLEQLESAGLAKPIFLPLNIYGFPNPDDLEHFLSIYSKDIALVTLIGANNETGVISPIDIYASITYRHNVPFHTDIVQLYGKEAINIAANKIDAFTMSFHKLGGPQRVGCLAFRKSLGFDKALVAGTQYEGLRGGTENIALLAGCYEALKETFKNRGRKNRHLRHLHRHVRRNIRGYGIPVFYYQHHLPSTVLIDVSGYDNTKICEALKKCGIVVGIGSACNGTTRSHVSEELKINSPIRISFADYTTRAEVNYFLECFHRVLS